MKTTSEVFKEVLEELGFAGYKPSQMTNSDYWLCTTTAMEKYAELVKNCSIPAVVGRSEQIKAFVSDVAKGFDDTDKHKMVKKARELLKSL